MNACDEVIARNKKAPCQQRGCEAFARVQLVDTAVEDELFGEVLSLLAVLVQEYLL